MTDLEAGRNNLPKAVLGTFALAVLFRVALLYSGVVDVVFFTHDSGNYTDPAKSLLSGSFLMDGRPYMGRTPGYPVFLAVIYAILGSGQGAVTAVQIVVDALTCAMVTHLALMFKLRKSAVLVASLLSATCLFTSAYSYSLMTETLYTFSLTAAGWILLAGGPRDADEIYQTTPTRMLFSGAILGFGILVRPGMSLSALTFAAMLVVSALARAGRKAMIAQRLLLPGLFCLGVVSVTAPWMVRNYLTFPEQFSGSRSRQVTLLGAKSPNLGFELLYTKEFHDFLASYGEPFTQTSMMRAPLVARYVYSGEERDVANVFSRLEEDMKATGRFREETLPLFAEIARKRYLAAPYLRVWAPVSRMFRIWITPRIAVLWRNASGHTSGLPLVAAMTLYGVVYVAPGFLGLWWGVRQSSGIFFIFTVSMIAGHTWLYAVWMAATQSRYAIPLFPLLSLSAGALAHYTASRR